MHGQCSNHSLSFNNPKWLCWNIRIALPVMNLVALAHPTVYLNKLGLEKFGFLEHSERKKSRKTMLLSSVFYFSCFRIHLQLIKRRLCFVIWMKHGKRQKSSYTVFKGETWRWKIRRFLPKTTFLLAVFEIFVSPEYDCMCSVFRCLWYSSNLLNSVQGNFNSQFFIEYIYHYITVQKEIITESLSRESGI